jgi:hypothetical protein
LNKLYTSLKIVRVLGWNRHLSKTAQDSLVVLETRSKSITDAELTADDLEVVAFIDKMLKSKMKNSKGVKN